MKTKPMKKTVRKKKKLNPFEQVNKTFFLKKKKNFSQKKILKKETNPRQTHLKKEKHLFPS